MVLDDLESLVDQVCGTDPAALGNGESIQRLHRCLARMEATTTRASAAFEASGEWRGDGARTASAWLARRCGLPSSSAARRRIRLGRALRHLPAAERAWLAGELGEAQVGALARARTPATEEALERDEELLVDEAIRLRFESCAPRGAIQPGGMKGPPPACRSRSLKLEAALLWRHRVEWEAASTTTGRDGTARRLGPGKQDGEVYV